MLFVKLVNMVCIVYCFCLCVSVLLIILVWLKMCSVFDLFKVRLFGVFIVVVKLFVIVFIVMKFLIFVVVLYKVFNL